MSILGKIWVGLALIGIVALAVGQTGNPGAPTLSTADRVAIQTFEKAKADARKQFDEATQGELAVEREWGVSHPGWEIDPATFEIKKVATRLADPATPPAPAVKK